MARTAGLAEPTVPGGRDPRLDPGDGPNAIAISRRAESGDRVPSAWRSATSLSQPDGVMRSVGGADDAVASEGDADAADSPGVGEAEQPARSTTRAIDRMFAIVASPPWSHARPRASGGPAPARRAAPV